MVSVNGIHSNARMLECASDHPVITVKPHTPSPKWRDQWPLYTHNLSWSDADNCMHSLTIRSDSITDLLSDLKMVKAGIRQAKEKAAQSQTQSDTQPEEVRCKVHDVIMERRVSKRTGGHYHSHKLPGNELCFGKSKS